MKAAEGWGLYTKMAMMYQDGVIVGVLGTACYNIDIIYSYTVLPPLTCVAYLHSNSPIIKLLPFIIINSIDDVLIASLISLLPGGMATLKALGSRAAGNTGLCGNMWCENGL